MGSLCDANSMAQPRDRLRTQIARRCLPTFQDGQTVSIFLMEDTMAFGKYQMFHQGFGLKATCDSGDSDCVEWTGDLVAGAYDFGNAQLPNVVDLDKGIVTYNADAIQLSFQVHEGVPDYWDRIYGLGTLTGAQANQLLDWACVPDTGLPVCPTSCSDAEEEDQGLGCCQRHGSAWPCHLNGPGNTCFCANSPGPCQIVDAQQSQDAPERDEMTPVWSTDGNWFASAGQYNIMGAESGKGLLENSAIPYLPASTCADFAFACLRFLSQRFGLKILPKPRSDGCKGAGCNATVLKHDRSSFVSYQPHKIGDVAGAECAQFWDYLLKASTQVTAETDKTALGLQLIELAADWIAQLNFHGLGNKACIYKNNLWWNTPLHAYIYPFDWNIWDALEPTTPAYNTDPYTCVKGVFTCKGQLDCSVGGLCISGDAFWSAAPYDVVITGGDALNSTAVNATFNKKLAVAADGLVEAAKSSGKTLKFYVLLGLFEEV